MPKQQEKGGGALRLERGSVAVFQGTADFIENSIKSTNMGIVPVGDDGGYRDVERARKGGAISNEVRCRGDGG